MSSGKLKEVRVAMTLGHTGHFSAVHALKCSGIELLDGATLEVDRKCLYEDNESFDAKVVEHDGAEFVEYVRTGPETATLDVIIYIHQ